MHILPYFIFYFDNYRSTSNYSKENTGDEITTSEPKKTCIAAAAIYDRCDMIRQIYYPPMKSKGGQEGKNSASNKLWIVWCEWQPGAGYLIVRVGHSRLLLMCQFDWANGFRGR